MTKYRILIVDDESTNISVLVEILSQKYELLVATDGERALEIVRSQESIDLILLDIIMPKMDGYEVADQLRLDESNIPFIFLTAKNDSQSVVKGFNLGAVDYLSKPFAREELLVRVKTHLKVKSLHNQLYKKVTQLDHSVAHYKALNLALPVGVVVHDAKTRKITFANLAAQNILQLSEEEIIGEMKSDLWTPIREDGSACEPGKHPYMITIETKKPQRDFIMGLKHKTHITWLDISSEPLFNSDGTLKEVIVTFTDISIQKKMQEDLDKERKRFSLAIEGSRDGLWDWDLLSDEAYISEQYELMLGYKPGEMPKTKDAWSEQLHPDDREGAFETIKKYMEKKGDGVYESRFRIRRKSGDYIWVLGRGKAEFNSNGVPVRFVGFNTDITEHVNQERALEHSAKHDPLTELPNRFLLSELLHQLMQHAKRKGEMIFLMFIDLDGFKHINDKYGHDAGDVVLKTVAKRMKNSIRGNDIVARLGGDEFVIAAADIKTKTELLPVLERILHDISMPITFEDKQLCVSASIGVSFYPQKMDVGSESLLRQADQAMYEAKTKGKNQYCFFNLEANMEIHAHQKKLEAIQKAIVLNEFVLYYQPKVNMKSGEIIGLEALLRWQHEEKGLLFPDSFLPLIENNRDLMIMLGSWVFDKAFKQLQEWRKLGIDIHLSINVSAYELQSGDFVTKLKDIFEKYPEVSPESIELEILETHAFEDFVHTSKILNKCRDIGVRISLDDFGTGYASLSHLKRIPLDTIKIDKTFVLDSISEKSSLSIVDASLALSRAFQYKIIAEGVESIEIGKLLIQVGYEVAQGYAIAKPMPADKVASWIEQWKNHDIWANTTALKNEHLYILYALLEHRKWVSMIEDYIRGKNSNLPQMDKNECGFGKWLASEESQLFCTKEDFEKLCNLHDNLHDYADEILKKARDDFKIKELQKLSSEILEKMNRFIEIEE